MLRGSVGISDRPKPRSMRDGRYLIGQGMAGAIYTHLALAGDGASDHPADGTALVETGSHDLGTGTYTVMRQIAADGLGISPDKVAVRLGDTRLPTSHASIGSATMANAGASVMLAAQAARDKAIELALKVAMLRWRAQSPRRSRRRMDLSQPRQET